MTGAVGYTQAIKEAVNNVASDGVTVTYPSGRKDTIETASSTFCQNWCGTGLPEIYP